MKSSELNLSAQLTISRSSRGDGKDVILITVHDPQSACSAVTLKIGLEEFALALTSVARQPCEAEWDVSKLGMKHEIRQEFVVYTPDFNASKEARALAEQRALAPFEKDGWLGDRNDLRNPHRRKVTDEGSGYYVTFHRWISP